MNTKKLNTVAALFSLFLLLIPGYITAQSVEELIKQGDELAVKEFNNQEALGKYLKAEKLSPGNWEIYWRLARAHTDIAEKMPSSSTEQKNKQLAEYEQALEYANKAVKLAPDKSITYIRRAVVNGRIALFKGIFLAIGLVKDVKEDAEKAIKYGNGGKETQALAHYILGRAHLKVCDKSYIVRLPLGLGWGDMKTAIAELEKSVELRPDFRMFHLDLARAYVKEDEFHKAKEHLYKIPYIPAANQEDDKYLSESKQLLSQIKEK
jgi:tetratricopeptide (TPR) repeat protein